MMCELEGSNLLFMTCERKLISHDDLRDKRD